MTFPRAQRARLDADRWHWQHGPIDIVAQADGDAGAVAEAHEAAWLRFATVLDELVGELPLLRAPIDAPCPLRGPVARRMWQACADVRGAAGGIFMTPMAAVAGSVAQELIACYARPGVDRAWLNNGGDIALHLAPGQSARVGLVADIAGIDPRARGPLQSDGQFAIDAAMPVRGVATSGWRGRSFSLGIADSVTVLAATAALADAAATAIANAVNVDDAAIERLPASACKDDADLGDIPVTVNVGALAPTQVRRALDAGAHQAQALQRAGLAWAAVLHCQGQWAVAQPLCSAPLQRVASGLPWAAPGSPSAGAVAVGSVFA